MWPARARGNKPRKRAANQGIVSLSCVTDRHRGTSSWLPDDWTNAPLSNRVGDFTKFYAYLQHEAFHKSIDGKECRVQKMRGRQSHATVSHRQMRRWKSWLNEALKFLLSYYKAEQQTQYLILCFGVRWVCVKFPHITWQCKKVKAHTHSFQSAWNLPEYSTTTFCRKILYFLYRVWFWYTSFQPLQSM